MLQSLVHVPELHLCKAEGLEPREGTGTADVLLQNGEREREFSSHAFHFILMLKIGTHKVCWMYCGHLTDVSTSSAGSICVIHQVLVSLVGLVCSGVRVVLPRLAHHLLRCRDIVEGEGHRLIHALTKNVLQPLQLF